MLSSTCAAVCFIAVDKNGASSDKLCITISVKGSAAVLTLRFPCDVHGLFLQEPTVPAGVILTVSPSSISGAQWLQVDRAA